MTIIFPFLTFPFPHSQIIISFAHQRYQILYQSNVLYNIHPTFVPREQKIMLDQFVLDM